MGSLGLDAVLAVKSYWRLIVGLSVSAGLLVFLIVQVLPGPSWEAVGVIRIGQAPDGVNSEPQLLMPADETEQFLRSSTIGAQAPGGVGIRLRKVAETMFEFRVTGTS